jgi:hypothetical protein
MAFTFKWAQSNENSGTAVTTLTITLTNAQTAGDLLVVFIGNQDTQGTLGATPVADTAGNTWLVGRTHDVTTPEESWAFYAQNCKAASASANTITITWGAVTTNSFVMVAEFGGVATSGALDTSNGAVGASATSSVVLTTTGANRLIVACNNQDSNAGTTPGTGFTMPSGGGTGNPTAFLDSGLEYQFTNSSGSNTVTMTQTASPWIIQAMAFIAAAGGGAASAGAFGDDPLPKRVPIPRNEAQDAPPFNKDFLLRQSGFLHEEVRARPSVAARPEPHDSPPFKKNFTLLQSGWLHEEVNPRWRPSARPEDQIPQKAIAAAALLSIGFLTEDARAKTYRSPQPEEQTFFTATKPLASVGAFTDDVQRGWRRRPSVDDDRPTDPAAILAATGSFSDDAILKRTHAPMVEDWVPLRPLSAPTLTSIGWLVGEHRPSPTPRRWADDNGPFDATKPLLPVAPFQDDSHARPAPWRRARDEEWAPLSPAKSALPSIAALADDAQVRRPARPWLEPESLFGFTARSSGWLAEDPLPRRARSTLSQDERPVDALPSAALPSAGWLVDDARATRRRPPFPEEAPPFVATHPPPIGTLDWLAEEAIAHPRYFPVTIDDGGMAVGLGQKPAPSMISGSIRSEALLTGTIRSEPA